MDTQLRVFVVVFGVLVGYMPFSIFCRYEPNWDSLDKRPLPGWYDEVKFGIFITWGLYSVPGFGSEWFLYNWQYKKDKAVVDFMKKNYPPGFTYADFAAQFTAEFYDPDQWADIIEASGAK
jgi:alpha-L-fucosidase